MAKRARTDVLTTFVAATPAVAARLRRQPEGLHALLDGPREETGLDRWAHGVQFLLAGKARGVRGPLALLTTGGEKLGRSARWLSPEQVTALSKLLDDTAPDDLGDDTYDPARLDAERVAPGGWVRAAEETDRLSQMRELYAYLREHLSRQRKARKGVLVVTRRGPSLDDDDGGEAAAAPVEAPPPAPPATRPGGELLLEGEDGRRYERGAATPPPTLDPDLARLGLRPLGDMVVRPALEDGVVRTYRSDDGTILGAVILDGARVASTTFLSLLERDALVLTSDAFTIEKVKRRYFARTVSRGTPEQLLAALRERRAELAQKQGAPVAHPAELISAARAWEAWWSRLR